MGENLRLDHVSIGARDIGATAKWLESVAGLRSSESWNFPGGLANRIFYSGGCAIEILGIGFKGAEMVSPLNGQISARTSARDIWLTWALATDDIDATAARLGLEVMDGGAFSASNGETISWKMCGVMEAFFSEPYLPFFLSYAPGSDGWRERALQPEPAFDVARIELTGDRQRLAEWLGDAELPVAVEAGPSCMQSVVLETTAGEVELEPE